MMLFVDSAMAQKYQLIIDCPKPLLKYDVNGEVIKEARPFEKFTIYANVDNKTFSLVPDDPIIVGNIKRFNSEVIVLEIDSIEKYVYAYFFKSKAMVIVSAERGKSVDIGKSKDFYSGMCNFITK